MKIKDFKMQEINIADDGQPVKMGTWKSGSRSNLMGVGKIGDKKYQVKIHAGEPKWYNTGKQIDAKKAELRACSADDFETKTRLESELNSIQANKAKYDEKDRISDAYLDYKKRLISAIKSSRDPLLVCPDDFWKEPIEMKANAVFSAEAVPWVDDVAVGFDSSAPIVFNRDLDKNTQYKIIASLAERLAHLHAAGVIHGDLKVGNTLIVKKGGQYQAVLIDFDASIILEDLHKNKVPFGALYYIVGGTYFSFETQMLFNLAREEQDEDSYNEFDKNLVDEKSDIFGLAITIYEYFYGRADMSSIMPFKAPDGEVLDQALYGLAVAQDYKPDFPDSMDELLYGALNWMLAKEPSERPTAQQVHDIFDRQDLSLIPSKYTRNPFWPEDMDVYKVVPKPNVSISKGPSSGKYKVTIGATTLYRNIQYLIDNQYVERIDGVVVSSKSEVNAPVDLDKTWDGSKTLPKCASRAFTNGLYTIYISGYSKTVRENYLESEGILCPPEDVTKPWPCDKEITIITSKHVERDFSKFKGPGHYKVGTGINTIQYTKQRLLDQGLASVGVSFSLWSKDAAEYVPNPAGVPATVKSIFRDTVSGKGYSVVNTSGKRESCSLETMVSRGYIKKK